jgi:hypothetical protein
VLFKPRESKTVPLSLKIQFTNVNSDTSLLLITGGRIIFSKLNFYIQPTLMRAAHQTEIVLQITNCSDKAVVTPPNFHINMIMVSLDKSPSLQIEWAKIRKKSFKGQNLLKDIFHLTHQQVTKFLSAKQINIILEKGRNFETDPPYSPPEKIDLLEMAENSSISATSFMININHQRPEQIQLYAFDNQIHRDGIDRKTYFPVYINNYRVVVCADSGSDLTIIQFSLFKKLFKNARNLLKDDTGIKITSYSNNDLKVLGQCPVQTKFKPKGLSVTLILTVVSDIATNVPTFLFGNDSMRETLATLAFTGDVRAPTPEVIIKKPQVLCLKTYYQSPRNTMMSKVQCKLEPNSSVPVTIFLDSAAPVVRTDEVLITSYSYSTLQAMASKSDLVFDHKNDCFTATALVVNTGNTTISATIVVRIEILPKYAYKSYLISASNKAYLQDIMSKAPPAREILPQEPGENFHHPVPSVFNVNLTARGQPELNLDFKDTAGAEKVTYTGTAEIGPQIIEGGLEVPTLIYDSPEKALQLDTFDAEIRPYIRKIFLEKYPNVVALHSLDSGDVSKTLGYTTLRLIPGETLPRHRRIFHLSPSDSRYLEELLEQFIRFNFVRRAPVDSTNIHLYGMSTYLVPRKKLTDIARLVIDFSPLTTIIQSPPSIVPDISASLQQLQGKALFSVMDLKYAYLALRICEESKPLTTFLTPGGAYQWLSLPTGAACSPAYFIDAVNRILHNEPVLDASGEPIYESPNKVQLKHNPLPNSFHYFDDILCGTELRSTYQETLDYHFECLEKIIYRLAFHGVKLSVNKSEFAKSKVLFLGWIVSHDYILPDPRRMEKIKLAQFPQTKKEVRSFLGLVNSIRRVIPFEVIKELQVLTPLTSSTATFEITEKHQNAFNKIKELLLTEPLFCNLINEKSVKYLWVDAASSSGCLGAVLAQRIQGTESEKYLPTFMNLSDPVHRTIYDKKLLYEPCKLYTSFPIETKKISYPQTIPPSIKKYDEMHGFTENNWHDSLFWSVISLMVLYNCKIPSSTLELRKLATQELKKGILSIKLKDQSFNNNHSIYRKYLDEFDQGQHQVDKDLLLVHALAKAIHRCIVIIYDKAPDGSQKIIKFNYESTKPPLIFGLHHYNNKVIFTPFFLNRNLEFNLDSLKGKIQIIAYLAKSVPEAYKSRSILDLEALAILTALHSLQRYISNTKCYLLTDSRVLYYLFSKHVGDSSTKIRRWVLKLLSDYPLVILKFIRTTANLADYLTRQGLPKGDLKKFNINQIEIHDFYDKLPKDEFTLQEWAKYCEEHPEYLTINAPSVNCLSSTLGTQIGQQLEHTLDFLSQDNHYGAFKQMTTTYYSDTGIHNILDLTEPLGILKEKFSRANIVKFQKTEFRDIYEHCLASDNFEYVNDNNDKTYKLITDLLMVKDHDSYKIYVPKILIGPLLSFTHLLGHQGIVKMTKNLESYYFENQYTTIKKFVSCCYGCFLSHGSSRKNKLGNYPIPNFPFEEVSVDLAESLNTVGGLSHLLIVQCVLTDFILIYPLKTKTAQEVCKAFLYCVMQPFNLSRIHSDNGPCFKNTMWLKLMASLNIQIVNASALNPSSRGKAERAVQQVKLLFKKFLSTASSDTLNWDLLPFLVSKVMNHTVTPRTGFKPAVMVFGQDNMSQSFLDRDRLLPVHHSVRANSEQIATLSEQLKNMSLKAKEELIELRQITHEKVNKNRIDKHFKPNDIVFVLDRYVLIGNSRPLKTKYYPSPYVVLKPYFTTCLVKRLADGFVSLYSMDDLKKYQGTDPIFSTLPPEVNKVLLHDFRDLIDTDFKIILQHDPLDLPTGIPLVDTVDPDMPDNSEIFTDKDNNKHLRYEMVTEEQDLPFSLQDQQDPLEPDTEDSEEPQHVQQPIRVNPPEQRVTRSHGQVDKRITRSQSQQGGNNSRTDTRTTRQQSDSNHKKVKQQQTENENRPQTDLDIIEELHESDSD